ncbi:lipoprotein [Bacteroidia bacterium]|nr:lipoprotein [Bacteroidia bacterium]
MNTSRFFMLIAISFSLLTCKEDIGGSRFTFTEDLVFTYLEKDPELYSEFVALLKASGVADLLSAYGTYTVFAPTNEAVRKYYTETGTSLEQMTEEEIRDFTFNHILPIELLSLNFPQGVVGTATMSEKFLNITYSTNEDTRAVIINDNAKVIILDQEVHNGIVHTVDAVILSSKIQLPEIIEADGRFNLFTKALFMTGMSDSLRMMDDKTYVSGTVYAQRVGRYFYTPPFRKIGATALVESDSVYAANGINNIDDLKAYAATIYDEMYPQDRNVTDVTNRRNSLNRFVSYHLMNRVQAANEFITEDIEYFSVRGTIINQYIEMMCPNTLLEIQTDNLINKRKNGDAIRFLTVNHEAMNGMFHEIDGILTYDRGVEDDVLNKRLRMDIASMIPELITNKLRRKDIGDNDRWWIPAGYMSTLTFDEATQPNYISCTCWSNYEGDEFMMGGKFDLTLRIPPIPAGTYEIRLGYSAYGNRGVDQIYFDNMPCGIPVNMNLTADNALIGWKADNTTEDDGIENDKMMKNRGYLKGPTTIWCSNQTLVMRNDSRALRKVLLTKTLDKTEAHYLRIKSVEERTDRQAHLDFMEFVPTYYLENEKRD